MAQSGGTTLSIKTGDLETDPKAFVKSRSHPGQLNISPREHGDSERYDPAGAEVTKGEFQWRIKFVMPSVPVPVQRIVGIARNSIKIYDKQGQTPLHEFPYSEISGFQSDSGRESVFFLYGFGSPEKNTYTLHSSHYYARIHEAINVAIAAKLKEQKVVNPEKVIEEAGLNQVSHTGTLDVIKTHVRRLSRGFADAPVPNPEVLLPPPAPERRDSAVHKASNGRPSKSTGKPPGSADLVELEDD